MDGTSLILDFETLDTSPTAIVTEVGCIALHRSGDTVRIIDELELFPDIFGQLANGRTYSRSTLLWHQKKDNSHLTLQSGITIEQSTAKLSEFIALHNPSRIWAWGKDFERPLYENLCRFSKIAIPDYQFRRFACARDKWQDAFGLDAKASPRTHRALHDCRDEARDLVTALNALHLFHVI